MAIDIEMFNIAVNRVLSIFSAAFMIWNKGRCTHINLNDNLPIMANASPRNVYSIIFETQYHISVPTTPMKKNSMMLKKTKFP